MMRGFVLIGLLALTACQSEGDKAAEHREWLEANGGSNAELCAAARAAEMAYAREENEEKYQDFRLATAMDCLRASEDMKAGL